MQKLSADSLAGIALTFLSFGSGNNHEFEMSKKNEKALLSIDGVVQSPIAFTPITTKLEFAFLIVPQHLVLLVFLQLIQEILLK